MAKAYHVYNDGSWLGPPISVIMNLQGIGNKATLQPYQHWFSTIQLRIDMTEIRNERWQ